MSLAAYYRLWATKEVSICFFRRTTAYERQKKCRYVFSSKACSMFVCPFTMALPPAQVLNNVHVVLTILIRLSYCSSSSKNSSFPSFIFYSSGTGLINNNNPATRCPPLDYIALIIIFKDTVIIKIFFFYKS